MLRDNFRSGKIAAVYVYGSVLKRKLRADSDIDIAMLPFHDVDDMERLKLVSQVEGALATSLRNLGIVREVSVLDMRGRYVSLELLYGIIIEGKIVFEGDASQRIEFENAVKGEYFDFEPYLRHLREIKYGHMLQKA